jgi:hypothetical protein
MMKTDLLPTSLPMSRQRHKFLQHERQADDYETHANADGHTVPPIGRQGIYDWGNAVQLQLSGFSRPQERCKCSHTASFAGDIGQQQAEPLQTWVSLGPCPACRFFRVARGRSASLRVLDVVCCEGELGSFGCLTA